MEKGFNKIEFIKYLSAKFYGFEDNGMLKKITENIINYGQKHERISKDQFCYWISDMIPGIDFGEVAMFMDNSCLTDYGIKIKNKYLGIFK